MSDSSQSLKRKEEGKPLDSILQRDIPQLMFDAEKVQKDLETLKDDHAAEGFNSFEGICLILGLEAFEIRSGQVSGI